MLRMELTVYMIKNSFREGAPPVIIRRWSGQNHNTVIIHEYIPDFNLYFVQNAFLDASGGHLYTSHNTQARILGKSTEYKCPCVKELHPLPRGEGGPEGVGRGMRAEIQKSAPCKDLLKGWLLHENDRRTLDELHPTLPPAFLFSQGIGSEEPMP